MAKTATSSLQSFVFPQLSDLGLVGPYNPQELVEKLDGTLNGYIQESEVCALASKYDEVFVSNETLLEWDPKLWEQSVERLARIFGREATILITLRSPKSYLRSLYQQVLHAGKIRSPEQFFLSERDYLAVKRFVRPGELDAFDVDSFDMVRMVGLLAAHFTDVVVVPFESIPKFRFLSAIWDISEQQNEQISHSFASSPRVNVSYTRLAVGLTLGRESLLARCGLKSCSATDQVHERALAYARGEDAGLRRRWLPSWSRLMGLLSRCGPQARYCLPESLYLGRYLERNANFYASLLDVPKGYLRFSNGVDESFDLRAVSSDLESFASAKQSCRVRQR